MVDQQPLPPFRCTRGLLRLRPSTDDGASGPVAPRPCRLATSFLGAKSVGRQSPTVSEPPAFLRAPLSSRARVRFGATAQQAARRQHSCRVPAERDGGSADERPAAPIWGGRHQIREARPQGSTENERKGEEPERVRVSEVRVWCVVWSTRAVLFFSIAATRRVIFLHRCVHRPV